MLKLLARNLLHENETSIVLSRALNGTMEG
uniref:Uncharacterized protein n=1 Tax=Arundo donax TaxID=35708 RepID=A0A0A8ZDE7_ARUDO